MRIVLDARGVRAQSDGMSNYVRHLVVNLLKVDLTNEYIVLGNQLLQAHLAQASLLERTNLRLIISSIPFMGPAQYILIPWTVQRLPRVTLYHYPHFDMPYLAHPCSVVTIFDVNQMANGYFGSLRRLKRFYSCQTTRLSVTKAHHILTISHQTKHELLMRFPWLDAQKVSVVYFGLNEIFQHHYNQTHVAQFRQKFHLGTDRFILYVGTDRPHKNLKRLLEAYAHLKQQMAVPPRLLLVGSLDRDGPTGHMIRALGLDASVHILGYLSEEELPLAYQASEVFAYCSVSEGFGMPLLEAMASGVPIITSRVGAMAEIVGESAILVDPGSVDSIAEGLYRALTSDEMRRQLIDRGLTRVKQFSWEESARKTLDVYARVVNERCVGIPPTNGDAPRACPG